MKSATNLFSGVIFLVVLMSIFPWSSQAEQVKNDPNRIEINFTKGLNPEELVGLEREFGLNPVEIIYRSGTLSAGYRLTIGEGMERALDNMEHRHREFLGNAMKEVGRAQSESKDALTAKAYEKLMTHLSLALSSFQEEGLTIHAATLLDDVSLIDLMRSGLVAKINRVQGAVMRQNHAAGMERKSYYHEPWAPYFGESRVARTFIFNTFYFNNEPGYSGFGWLDNTAYEHETQIYDPGFANYGNYWASNMTGAYLDSAALEPNSSILDNFTVGTTMPLTLKPYNMFYVHIALSPQSSSSTPQVIIKGQMGYKIPGCHYWTWCVPYPRATTGALTSFTAPNTAYATWIY